MAKQKGKHVKGTVYLVHLNRRFHHVAHYIGFTEAEVESRLDEHRKGSGAKLLRAARSLGIDFQCVRTWVGTRSVERALKNRKDARSLCPECRADRRAAQLFSKKMRELGVRRIQFN